MMSIRLHDSWQASLFLLLFLLLFFLLLVLLSVEYHLNDKTFHHIIIMFLQTNTCSFTRIITDEFIHQMSWPMVCYTMSLYVMECNIRLMVCHLIAILSLIQCHKLMNLPFIKGNINRINVNNCFGQMIFPIWMG